MEYMDGLSLDKVLNRVGRIPETILARVTYAVLQALTYLKDVHNVLHRGRFLPFLRLAFCLLQM